MNKYYLYPASLFAVPKSHYVDTILGSCVAVCLYEPDLKIGGINHFMLPLWNGNGLATPKYGNIAIDKLLEKMLMMGASKKKIIAKIFGGAHPIKYIPGVGMQNIHIAREHLAAHGIKIISESVGGPFGRKICFNSGTGEVWVHFIR